MPDLQSRRINVSLHDSLFNTVYANYKINKFFDGCIARSPKSECLSGYTRAYQINKVIRTIVYLGLSPNCSLNCSKVWSNSSCVTKYPRSWHNCKYYASVTVRIQPTRWIASNITSPALQFYVYARVCKFLRHHPCFIIYLKLIIPFLQTIISLILLL